MKELDFSKSLFDLVVLYPEIKELMYKLGFEAIAKPGALQTKGRNMTIPNGAQMKNLPLETVIEMFEKHGFSVTGLTS